MKSYKTVYKGGEAEIVEKKSRFIATIRPAETEEAALTFIAEMKKKNWNASHNCFAFVLGENQELQRCSDDGEPNGTAGRPMLDILLQMGIHNTVVVVTRYFGGTLLGTGGLVRAYSGAVQAGLDSCTIIEKLPGFLLRIETDYHGVGKIQYVLGQRGCLITDSAYTDKVILETLVPADDLATLQAELTESTSGKAVYQKCEPVCFALLHGQAQIFP